MYENFFMQHLIDQVQDEYSLSDEEMSKLIEYLEKFEQDPKKALKRARKKRNKKNLDNIIQVVLNKELVRDADTRFNADPMPSTNGPFVFPVGLPLTKDMIIEPHKMYEDF